MTALYKIEEKTNLISKEILDVCFYVHKKLGPGLLESVYEECVFQLLKNKNIKVERQKNMPVKLDDIVIQTGLKLDLLVEDQVIVELKAAEKLIPLYEAQLQTYMKLANAPLGLLINFNTRSLKDGIKRLAMAQNHKNSV